MKKTILLILFTALASSLIATSVDYNQHVKSDPADAERLVSLNTRLHSTIYLKDNQATTVLEATAPLVIYSDVASLELLYEENENFNTVEVIKINLTSVSDETTKLDVSKFKSLDNLRYILFIYEYNACSDKSNACLQGKTDALVTLPSGSTVQVLYDLSIPQ